MQPKIRALVFDMDGLLFDSEKSGPKNRGISPENGWDTQNVGDHIYHTLGFNVVRKKQVFQGDIWRGISGRDL